MNNTKNIARGGLYAALTVILIYISGIIPTSKLSLLTIVSAIIPYSILTTGVKNSFVVYFAASLLSLILGIKGIAFAYVIFFGLYGFVKYYVEALDKMVIEFIIKFVFFNLSMGILYFAYSSLFTDSLSTKLPIYLIIIGAEIAFIIYDYALTLIINYIRTKFIKK
ncbi:hypothetical protein IAI10_18810 [Clostridium sp. 19966]|uniref:hypothetical protein n=1 Tax=Clostridium sp. 19966 TaxID=2768166 RepID=UPI0028E09454|nr:hypothetical protein [Clostridium sp. 19966]MDT8718712.1 hypothetical protein [Clostridium sp. 19966]